LPDPIAQRLQKAQYRTTERQIGRSGASSVVARRGVCSPSRAPWTGTSGAVLAGDPSIQSVDDLAQSRSRSLAVSSTARFESVETDALVGSLAYDR
jgi:hypothetical protein